MITLKRLLRGANPWVGSIESTTSSDVVLTFDDGPDAEQTPPLLDALAEHGATATFFVLLTRVRQHSEILRSIVDGGHEVGLHGPDHLDLTRFAGPEVERRTSEARRELEDHVGRRVRWFRPPYGRLRPGGLLAVRRAGMDPVLWSATAWDWQPASPEERRRRALRDARAGAILLAHDGFATHLDGVDDGPPGLRERAAWMAELLAELDDRGLVGCSLGEALESSRAIRTLRVTLSQSAS